MTRRAVTFERRAKGAGLVLLVGALLSGCVTVYQPLSSLQRPAIVDPQIANFEGLRLLVRCVPGDYIKARDAELLCRKVSSLFRNQGAQVETDVPREGRSSRSLEEGAQPDLVIDLSSRLLNRETPGALWALTVLSATLIPVSTEYSVAQDVTIRDASGFLLASDSLKARFIEYFGAGIWAVNALIDLARPDEEDLTGDAPARDFSRDFYAQLSQLTFNARVRSDVLRSFEPRPAGGNEQSQTGTEP